MGRCRTVCELHLGQCELLTPACDMDSLTRFQRPTSGLCPIGHSGCSPARRQARGGEACEKRAEQRALAQSPRWVASSAQDKSKLVVLLSGLVNHIVRPFAVLNLYQHFWWNDMSVGFGHCSCIFFRKHDAHETTRICLEDSPLTDSVFAFAPPVPEPGSSCGLAVRSVQLAFFSKTCGWPQFSVPNLAGEFPPKTEPKQAALGIS